MWVVGRVVAHATLHGASRHRRLAPWCRCHARLALLVPAEPHAASGTRHPRRPHRPALASSRTHVIPAPRHPAFHAPSNIFHHAQCWSPPAARGRAFSQSFAAPKQEKVEASIEKQPVARALAKVVEEDGFKTVFVLRLSPLLPIPLGTYAYIYGASALDSLAFASATFLGSLKPYLIDSYLGVFSKQILDGDRCAGLAPPERW